MTDATRQAPDGGAGGHKGRIRFRTTLLQAGKTATGVQVPDEVMEKLGSGKRPAVRITINGYSYRNTVAVMGGKFMVGVSAEHRAGAKVAGGDEIEVEIELDTAPREVAVPADFQAVLDGDAKARLRFEALSYSRKKALLQGVLDAKTAQTRQRHFDKALAALRGA